MIVILMIANVMLQRVGVVSGYREKVDLSVPPPVDIRPGMYALEYIHDQLRRPTGYAPVFTMR